MLLLGSDRLPLYKDSFKTDSAGRALRSFNAETEVRFLQLTTLF